MLVDRALQFSGRSDVSYFLLRFFFNIKKTQPCSPKNFPVWHLGYSVNQHAFLGHRIKRGGFPRTHILASQTENRCRKIQNHKGGTEGEESCEVASRWLYEGRWNYSGKCPRKDELRACLNIWGGGDSGKGLERKDQKLNIWAITGWWRGHWRAGGNVWEMILGGMWDIASGM